MTEQDREPGKYLNTLAFRCTPELVGTAEVFVRHFDEATWKLWDDFDRQCKQRYNSESAQAPYSIATTVLSMMGGGYVCFAPDRQDPFLASLHPIDSKLLQPRLHPHLSPGARPGRRHDRPHRTPRTGQADRGHPGGEAPAGQLP